MLPQEERTHAIQVVPNLTRPACLINVPHLLPVGISVCHSHSVDRNMDKSLLFVVIKVAAFRTIGELVTVVPSVSRAIYSSLHHSL